MEIAMRRFAFAALSAVLALAACNDQNRQSPTEPSATPGENLLTSCRETRFPLLTAAGLIVKVFPQGKLRVEALARATVVALLWDTCKRELARKAAAGFLDFMNRNSRQLTGTQAQRDQLIALMFTGVGLPSPGPIVLGPDFGIGTVDPNATTATRIETEGHTGLIQFEPASGSRPAAFSELTVVSIHRRPDGSVLDGFPPEDQYPPFWDYTATNASNNHEVNPGAVARMAFCLLGSTRFPYGYPDGVRIGHNPDVSEQPPAFEIIPEDPDVVADFGGALVCSNLLVSLGSFGGGLQNFGRAAGRFFGPLVRTLFLPQPLMAVVVGGRGPLGGLPPTLSDFGVVNATSYFGYEDGEPAWNANESFWNRRSTTVLTNSAYPGYVSTFDAPGVPGGTVPTPFRKSFSGWYGQVSTGNYIGTQADGDLLLSGGTSIAPNTGAFVSPEIDIPNVPLTNVQLRFKTWWEIEGQNPSGWDLMTIEIVRSGVPVAATTLNPTADPGPTNEDRHAKPYTSAGFNTAPTWNNVAIDLSAFRGQRVRIRFTFDTRDKLYNGFRGWLVEDVRVSTGTSGLPSLRLQTLQGAVVPGRDLPPVSRP
jgi:hypothetical protein